MFYVFAVNRTTDAPLNMMVPWEEGAASVPMVTCITPRQISSKPRHHLLTKLKIISLYQIPIGQSMILIKFIKTSVNELLDK